MQLLFCAFPFFVEIENADVHAKKMWRFCEQFSGKDIAFFLQIVYNKQE